MGYEKRSWAFNFPLGMAAGAILAFTISWILGELPKAEIDGNFIALFQGIITLVVAAVAMSGVSITIKAHSDQQQENRNADLTSARSVLPLALSDLSEYALIRVREILTHNYASSNLFSKTRLNFDEPLQIFRDCIRAAPTSEHSSLLIHSIRWLQIAQSRSQYVTRDDASRRIADWMLVFAAASSLFSYARNEKNAPAHLDTNLINLSSLLEGGSYDATLVEECRQDCKRYRSIYSRLPIAE